MALAQFAGNRLRKSLCLFPNHHPYPCLVVKMVRIAAVIEVHHIGFADLVLTQEVVDQEPAQSLEFSDIGLRTPIAAVVNEKVLPMRIAVNMSSVDREP